ncbi:MAG: ferredoxin family protein [Deltaproteobacteria bacterium]|nr:ferredoxin family protein [Deltaproteobacteria bacterium]
MHNVFTVDDEGYPRAVKPVECNLCGFCVTRCPDFALRTIEGKDADQSA